MTRPTHRFTLSTLHPTRSVLSLSTRIKIYRNFTEKKALKPPIPSAEGLFGGQCIGTSPLIDRLNTCM